jgi:hypothetical protein
MNEQNQRKLSDDVSYLRGRFDAMMPMMQSATEKINIILEKQEDRIRIVEESQTGVKTKVGIFGSLAGLGGGALVGILVEVARHYLTNQR